MRTSSHSKPQTKITNPSSHPEPQRPAITLETRDAIISQVLGCEIYRNICRKIARHDLADDLYQEFLLTMLTYDNLAEIYQKQWFQYFCVKVITNLYQSKTSTFYLKYRHQDKVVDNIPESVQEPNDPDGYGGEKLLECVNAELNRMDWYDQHLFRAYLQVRSTRRLASQTRIPKNNIVKTLGKVKRKLRQSSACLNCLQDS